MTTKRSTKRALLLSALSLLLCVSMLVGSTFAWFTDSVTSKNNIIKSGNLEVELYYTYDPAVANDAASTAWEKVDSTTDIYGKDNLWEPGFTKVAYFKVVNKGNLNLKYQLAADVYAEKAGTNKAGEKFLLSDYIRTDVVTLADTRDTILAKKGVPMKASLGMSNGILAPEANAVVGMAIWMPTTVGNEANHNGDAPEITFGINLIATQATVENDSFGPDYDEDAVYPEIDLPAIMTAGVKVDGTTERYDIGLYTSKLNDDGGFAKQGSVVVPKEAIDANAENIEVIIKKMPIADSNVPVGQNEKAATIDVTVTGIKENNTTPVEVTVNIGPNLGTIKLYHKNVEIPYISYSNTTGVLIFESTSFSPFTIVYDGEKPVYDDNTTPNADVADITATFGAEFDWEAAWQTGKLLDPIGKQKLDAVYEFKAPHTSDNISECAYKEWECDYYVMLKSDTMEKLPEGYIALGGNYGDWGWNGFYNPEVDANVEIPLLGSVTNNPWTYEGIVNLVSTFWCGVGVNKEIAGTELNGSEFIVMLRLTNPETREYVNVATVTYDFATGNSECVESIVVNNAQGLQDALNGDSDEVVLGGDVDLNDLNNMFGN